MTLDPREEQKRLAAERALRYVVDGDIVGVGTGSTVRWFIEALGRDAITSLAARQASYARMREVTQSAFAAFADRATRFAGQPLRLLGTSGTVTTLASVFLNLPRYDRRAVDGLAVPADAMRDISRRLAEASLDDRADIACIGRERADLVVAGCAILESIIDLWPAARVGVADRGIREGILRTLAMQGRDVPVTRREHRK